MDITPSLPEGARIINGYGPEGFRVAGVTWLGPIAVFPGHVMNWTSAPDAQVTSAGLALENFVMFIEATPRPEVILFGTGRRGIFMPPTFRDSLRAHGISIDAMDTGAACRAFNVMLSEGRPVAAALLLAS